MARLTSNTALLEVGATARKRAYEYARSQEGNHQRSGRPCLYVKNMQNDVLIVKKRSEP